MKKVTLHIDHELLAAVLDFLLVVILHTYTMLYEAIVSNTGAGLKTRIIGRSTSLFFQVIWVQIEEGSFDVSGVAVDSM